MNLLQSMSKYKYIKESIYILTEGQTEEAYFSRIAEILGGEDEWKFSVKVEVREIVDGSKQTPIQMIKEAKAIKKEYDEVWIVFDKDRDRDEQNEKALNFANRSNIHTAFSSISFETWVLLHFERSTYAFLRSDCESRGDICSCNGATCISTYIKQNHYPAFIKGKSKLYDDICDRINNAMEFSAWVKFNSPIGAIHLLNPYTDLDILVSKLLDLPEFFFVATNTQFIFEGMKFIINSFTTIDGILFVELNINNTSDKTFLLNNVQNNIIALSSGNVELNYSIAEPVTIYPEQNEIVSIQFDHNTDILVSRIKFLSSKAIIFSMV